MPPTATTPRLPPSTPGSAARRFISALALACCAAASASSAALAQAQAEAQTPTRYDPPGQFSSSLAADPAALLRQWLPGGATLLHAPQALPFGAYEQGTLLVLATAGQPKGYAVWYLTAAEEPGQSRLIRLRDPEPADEFIDWHVRAVFSVGDPGDQHLVLLDSASRAAPAGGTQQEGGSVWRRVGGGSQRLPAESRRLNGVADAAAARALLAPLLKLDSPALLPGALPAAFLSLPARQVDLTRRERLDRVQIGSRWLQVNDAANGYLDLRGDAGLPGYRLALFKRADGAHVVAVQRHLAHSEGQQTWFLRGLADAWRDVSAELVPGYELGAAYSLPRLGTTLALPGGRALRWNGSVFEIQGRGPARRRSSGP
jgi:hypothetical protein